MNKHILCGGPKSWLVLVEAIITVAIFMGWLFWSISSESPSKLVYYNF